MQIDPICGMKFDENTAQYKTVYNGKTYYFCAPGCKKAFEAEPEKYLKSGPVVWAENPVEVLVVYFCSSGRETEET